MKGKKMNKVILEWSDSQNCFHIDQLENSVLKNHTQFMLRPDRAFNDYQIIGLYETGEEALEAIKRLQIFADRRNYQNDNKEIAS